MTKRIHRRPGAQPGNHNALRHGFYSKNKVIVDRDKLPARAAVKELDHDVALSRATLRRLYAKDPDNVILITRTLSLHDRLIRTRQHLIDRARRAKRRQSRRALRASATRISPIGLAHPPSPKSERELQGEVRGTTSFKLPQISFELTARKCASFTPAASRMKRS